MYVVDPVTGAQISPRFDFSTSDNCDPTGGGIQSYQIEFKKNGGTPAPTATPQPPGATPVATATPISAFPYQAGIIKASYPNCGLTNVFGHIYYASGSPISGVTVKVGVADGDWWALSNPSQLDGYWDMLLGAGTARAGRWYAVVSSADGNTLLSPRFDFNTSSDCTPGAGVQSYELDFRSKS
ncbi:MAG: hypothetical protein Q7O66_02665 [Dehalococcoidia bacterium]|nr:hypothetical protein [Dehalococcoidia bacterium]